MDFHFRPNPTVLRRIQIAWSKLLGNGFSKGAQRLWGRSGYAEYFVVFSALSSPALCRQDPRGRHCSPPGLWLAMGWIAKVVTSWTWRQLHSGVSSVHPGFTRGLEGYNTARSTTKLYVPRIREKCDLGNGFVDVTLSPVDQKWMRRGSEVI